MLYSFFFLFLVYIIVVLLFRVFPLALEQFVIVSYPIRRNLPSGSLFCPLGRVTLKTIRGRCPRQGA